MIVLTLFFVIPFERTDLCDIICSQLHINNLIEFGKSLTLSSWRCFLVWLVDRVVHLLSSWGWIATRDYSELPFPQLRNGKGVKKIHSQNSGTWREWITPCPPPPFVTTTPPPSLLVVVTVTINHCKNQMVIVAASKGCCSMMDFEWRPSVDT